MSEPLSDQQVQEPHEHVYRCQDCGEIGCGLADRDRLQRDNERLTAVIEAVAVECQNQAAKPEDGAPFNPFISAYANGFNAALGRVSIALSGLSSVSEGGGQP
jgi:hypothetical protein